MQKTLSPRIPEKETKMFLNPLINKISSIKDRSETVSTYAGIFGKFMYFLFMILVGIGISMILYHVGAVSVDPVTDELFVAKYAIIGIFVSLGMFIVVPLLAFLIRKTIPVVGALYCVGTGYLLGFFLFLDAEFGAYMLLAMALTFSIVIAMGILYFKGYIRISNKFRAVVMTLFSTMIMGSFLLTLCSFIPALKDSITMLQNNMFLSIGGAVAGVIIATLFLLIDFETIRETVEDKLPKEYEWYAAFSFMFTIVWLYFKVLQLVTKIQDATK